jgi:cysteine desulfurase
MILTTKGRYAVMAMLEMVRSQPSSAMSLSSIAANQNIPHNYLEQLFLKLKKAEIVTSIRGPGGGYKLNASPEQISIYRIIHAVEDDIMVPKCGHNKQCAEHIKCETHYLWHGLENNVVSYLSEISLADVIRGNCGALSSSKIEGSANDTTKIYLDYNATTPIDSAVRDEMNNILGPACNPSSLHWYGRRAKALIENARTKIANALGIKLGIGLYQITFTASGTEANNLLLHNFACKDMLISSTEHLSILEAAKEYGNRILLKVDQNGQIDMDHFRECVKDAQEGSLVSIIMANNETGIMQENMSEIIELAHEKGLLVHSDYVQAFGKVSIDLAGLDFITISSHKIGGPIGAAALVHKTKLPIKAQIIGGGQERGIRSGTENVAAIVGFGKASELIKKNYTDIAILRDKMENMIQDICHGATCYGKDTSRLPNTSIILMPGTDAQKQLIQFDLSNISVSAGSACSSGKMKTSHVLTAMGVDATEAKCTIRVSLGASTTLDEIRKFVSVWEKIWQQGVIAKK